MDEDRVERRVPLALLVAVVAISFAATFFKKAEPTHPLVSAGFRLLFAAGLLAPWTVRHLVARRPGFRFAKAAAFAGLLYGVHFGAWVASLAITPVAVSVTLVTTSPLLLAAVALATGRDRPGRLLWVALVLAVCGVSVIGGVEGLADPSALAGHGLAVLGAAAMAGYILVVRGLGPDLDPFAFSGAATAVGAAVLLGGAAAAGVRVEAASPEALAYLFLAALVPQGVGHTLITWTARHARPVSVGLATVGEPVGATVIAWLWLGEGVSSGAAVGCGITVAAVGMAAVASRRYARRRPESG